MVTASDILDVLAQASAAWTCGEKNVTEEHMEMYRKLESNKYKAEKIAKYLSQRGVL